MDMLSFFKKKNTYHDLFYFLVQQGLPPTVWMEDELLELFFFFLYVRIRLTFFFFFKSR